MSYTPNNPNGQATKANSAPVVFATEQETILDNIAKDGTDITTPTAMPTGGVGIRGWLSAIWTKLNGTLVVSGGAAVGVAPSTPPLCVSGVDGAGLKRHFLTTADGTTVVDGLVTNRGTRFNFSPVGINSTITQLASLATFTGSVESIVDQSGYSILAFSDQPGILTIRQFTDASGTKLNQTLSYVLTPNVGFARSGAANGNFLQVIFTNTGLVTTTGFEIDTAYGTIPPATQLNNNPVGIYEINGREINGNVPNIGSDAGLPVRLIPQQLFRTTFGSVLTNTWDSSFWNRISQGTGQVNSQASGNGLITTGTTINADTILRSNTSFRGAFNLKAHITLSQRIINQSFFVELVDVIGDLLTCVINSATSVTVTIPNNPFTSINIGQSMFMGAYSGTGTFVPSRYVIASIAGNAVTFTVAGFAAGSGTCSLFGWNYHQLLYNAAVATTSQYDAQRRGWNSGYTAISTFTTAAPGHYATMGTEDSSAFIADQLVASTAINPYIVRGSRVVNLAEETTPLFIQIRVVNGTVAPASNTTLTVGAVSMENYSTTQVTVANSKVQGSSSMLPVKVEGGVLGTVTTLGQFAPAAVSADASTNVSSTMIRTFGHSFNGVTWDRLYNNLEATYLISAARTITQTSADIIVFNAKKLSVVLNMTVVGTGSVTVRIQGRDAISGVYFDLLVGLPITTNSFNRYRVGEVLAAIANSVAQDYLPRIIRIVVTANNANTATYSVGYNLGL